MKKLFTLLTTVFAAVASFGQTYTTNVTVNTVVPDNNPSGLASSFDWNGLSGTINNVSVSLNLSGGYNGDLFAYLTGPGGYAVLLNRVGVTGANPNGYSDTGLAVTFLIGGADIHSYGAGSFTLNGAGQLTGNWGADGRAISPFSAGSVFDLTGRTALLDSFLGTTPNGTWGLYVADFSAGDLSTLLSYSVTISTVPEPGTLALLALGGLALFAQRRKN